MQVLNEMEMNFVSGAGAADNIQIGSGIGAVFGILMTNTLTGAAQGGAGGAALGAVFTAGNVLGGALYNKYGREFLDMIM